MKARLFLLPARPTEPWFDLLGPAALVTRDLGMPSRVLLPYRPEIAAQARRAADAAGVELTIEVEGGSACVSFRPASGAEGRDGGDRAPSETP